MAREEKKKSTIQEMIGGLILKRIAYTETNKKHLLETYY